MPRVRINRTAGARQGVSYVGVSQKSKDDGVRSARARRAKKKLLREAQALSGEPIDWKAASERLHRLHERWRMAGFAGEEHDQRLWKQFKKAGDQFRRLREAHYAEVKRLSRANAKAKEQLIAEAECLSSVSDYTLASQQLSDLMTRWRGAGHAGGLEAPLWEDFVAARQASYDATQEDRRSLQAAYVRRVEERVQRHREVIGKLRSLRRELTLRRGKVMPGWVGTEMIEEFDERIEGIDEALTEREEWLEQDNGRLEKSRARD
ncbi:MAG TPA: DUF349 domain-containing protein [Solirubrobacteraceae bacterium]|jgi:hypothetical protein|nr:DUF349 domain-containing protein [Solirubrobacteraceae bacterium]